MRLRKQVGGNKSEGTERKQDNRRKKQVKQELTKVSFKSYIYKLIFTKFLQYPLKQ